MKNRDADNRVQYLRHLSEARALVAAMGWHDTIRRTLLDSQSALSMLASKGIVEMVGLTVHCPKCGDLHLEIEINVDYQAMTPDIRSQLYRYDGYKVAELILKDHIAEAHPSEWRYAPTKSAKR